MPFIPKRDTSKTTLLEIRVRVKMVLIRRYITFVS